MPRQRPNQYRVVFTLNSDRQKRFPPGTIAISPSDKRWNDFGFRIRADVEIYVRERRRSPDEIILLECFIGFLNTGSAAEDTSLIRSLLQENPHAEGMQDAFPQFFSMLPDMAAYRSLVDDVGVAEARHILRAMHDVVSLASAPKSQSHVRSAVSSSIFLKAFIRSNESFFAWKNASSILSGLRSEEFGNVSSSLNIRFHLDGRPNPHDVTFNFDTDEHVLPKRFSIIIGANGVGKSQTLAQIVDAALRSSPTLRTADDQRPEFNRLLAFTPSHETATIFPRHRTRSAGVWYRRFSIASPGRGRNRQSTADLVVQLAHGREAIKGRRRFQIFLEALSAIDDHRQLALRVKHTAEDAVRISAIRKGGEQDFISKLAGIDFNAEPVRKVNRRLYALSSGEAAFVRFAALSSLYIENGSLVLIDEPETHLHPSFISQFVSLLDKLLEQTGSVSIIATHSAYFVRESFESQVSILKSDETRHIYVEKPTLRTFGADVGAISYFVFGQDAPSRLARAAEEKILGDDSNWNSIFQKYKDEISLDLLSEIRADIEGLDEYNKP